MPKTAQESLDSCLFFAIKKLDRALDKITEEGFQKLGLSPSYSTLLLILDHDNGKLQKDLAKMLCITAPTLTRIVEKLANKGFIQVISEGRTKRVYITEKGRNLIPDIHQAHIDTQKEFNRLVKNGFSDTLVSELNQITEQLK